MIIRIILAGFVSIVSGVCFLAGLTRLMSGLLIGFGILVSIFFGLVFLLPDSEILPFPVYGDGAPWPFFILAACLALLIVRVLVKKSKPSEPEQLSPRHLKFLGGGILLYLASLFLPIVLWSPSEESRQAVQAATQEMMVFIGVCLYLVGSSIALWLIYRASRGSTPENPDLMRRFVPAFFSFFHFDKMPALVAYLLVYSSDTQFVFPNIAVLALAAYIPVSIFLSQISFETREET